MKEVRVRGPLTHAQPSIDFYYKKLVSSHMQGLDEVNFEKENENRESEDRLPSSRRTYLHCYS